MPTEPCGTEISAKKWLLLHCKKNADPKVGIFVQLVAYFDAGFAGAAGAAGAGAAAEAAGAADAGLAAEAAGAAGAAADAAGAEAAGLAAEAEADLAAIGLSPTLQAVRAIASRPTINNDFFICFPSKIKQLIITGNLLLDRMPSKACVPMVQSAQQKTP